MAREILAARLAENESKLYNDDVYMQCLGEDIVACSNAVQNRNEWEVYGKKKAANMYVFSLLRRRAFFSPQR